MRRTHIGYSVALALCAMVLLASCDPQVGQAGISPPPDASSSAPNGVQVTAGPSSPEPSEPAPSEGQTGPSLVELEYGDDPLPWYGEWQVEDYTFAPISALSVEDAQALLSGTVAYGKNAAVSQNESYSDPYYSAEWVQAEDFAGEYRGGLTFGDIWLDGESAQFVAVNNADFFGDRFYVRDGGSLVIERDGAFFLARRKGQTLDEASVVQSFDVQLDGWGKVRFVSYLPVAHEDAVFLLEQDGKIIYTFPAADGGDQGFGVVDSVKNTAFQDVDGDGQMDVIVIVDYAAGPQGMEPRPALRLWLRDGKRFTLASDLMAQVMEYVSEAENGNLTMDAVRACLGLNGA